MTAFDFAEVLAYVTAHGLDPERASVVRIKNEDGKFYFLNSAPGAARWSMQLTDPGRNWNVFPNQGLAHARFMVHWEIYGNNDSKAGFKGPTATVITIKDLHANHGNDNGRVPDDSGTSDGVASQG